MLRYSTSNAALLSLRYIYNEVGSICGFSLKDRNGENQWVEYYFATNLQGDVLQVYTATNDSTTGLPDLVVSYTYDAWGNILSSSGTLADINPFRYRGYHYDTETGFYYLQSRYYDPEIGRFINADTVQILNYDQGSLLGNNLFAYCINDPVNKKDISGFFFVTATLVTTGTILLSETLLYVAAVAGLLLVGICAYDVLHEAIKPRTYFFSEESNSNNGPSGTGTPSGNNSPNDPKKPQKIFNSIKEALGNRTFKKARNGLKTNNVKNRALLEELRKIESGKWQKIYYNGYNEYGEEISLHYFRSQTGKIFDFSIKIGWS